MVLLLARAHLKLGLICLARVSATLKLCPEIGLFCSAVFGEERGRDATPSED